MTTRAGINGFGRIGRAFMRHTMERSDLELVAVNDLNDPRTLAHLLRSDSTYGRFGHTVEPDGDSLIVDGAVIKVLSGHDPAAIGWDALGVSVVIEATGKFRAREDAAAHLKGGARKVVIAAPGQGADLTVVMGVNDSQYDPQRHDVISASSCASNCIVPMVKVLDDAFGGIYRGFMTTIHAGTSGQLPLDEPSGDLRQAGDIVPARTGASRTVGLVLPALAGKLNGTGVRVPVAGGSLTDLTVALGFQPTADEVNRAFAEAANGRLAGVLRYSTGPIAARDIIGDPASCVFDASLTQADANLVKVFGWYGNEWGYTGRLADLAALVGGQLEHDESW